MFTALTFYKATNEIHSVIKVSREEDLALNKPTDPELGMVEIPSDHEVLKESDNWKCDKDGNLERKPQDEIDIRENAKKEYEANLRVPDYLRKDEDIKTDILLETINELRKKAGLDGKITTEDILAELETRREKYKNQDKKELRRVD